MSFDPKWLQEAKKLKAKWLIVVCDTFDYDDYPVFLNDRTEMLRRVQKPGEMQRIMEVYDLSRGYHERHGIAWEIKEKP